MQRTSSHRLWALLLAVVWVAAQLTAFAPAARADEIWYTRSGTKLRAKASTSANAVITIKGGEEVAVVSRSNGWSQVRYGSHTGYVRSDLLVKLTRSGYIPLEKGNECPQVKDVQVALRDLGYFSGSCNGKYGEDTEAAVKAFQKRNSIGADGVAGGETQRVMYSGSAVTAAGVTVNNAVNAPSSSGTVGSVAGGIVGGTGATLKKGMSSTEVQSMQQQLKLLGYIDFAPDGVFGSGTEKAVTAFQKAVGIAADGKAGAATLEKLYSASAPKASGGSVATASGEPATLKLGDTGTAVKAMQSLLKNLGYITFTPDGVFGAGTEKAVMEFQSRNGLSADGKVGSATLNAMSGSKAVAAVKASAASAVSTKVTLKRGDSGSEVTKMQQRLRELGYIKFAADGAFGSGTRTGVIAFQKANKLTADGVAGPGTLTLLYSASAKTAPAGTVSGSSGGSTASSGAPASSSVKLLHFFDVVKAKYKSGTVITVYDPASGLSWKLKFMSLGRHADSEPLTSTDTSAMNKAFGNATTWTPKAVWVKFPDGVWSMATMHNTPHLSSTIKDNNFSGHLCVHFLRDMDEVSKNDPNYGVQNQKALRAAWKALTGQIVN